MNGPICFRAAAITMIIALLMSLAPAPAPAHEVRPAALTLRADASGTVTVQWQQPIRDGRRLSLEPVLPANCEPQGGTTNEATLRAVTRTFRVACGMAGLSGKPLAIAGLERTLTDVFVQVIHADGRTESHVLRPQSPQVVLGEAQVRTLMSYLRIGMEHILLGTDHVLFVICLLLLVTRDRLLWTVTAFTLAHSLTLALSAFGAVGLPTLPVEISIALSILLLAQEAARPAKDRPGVIRDRPWLVAFAFGLLHGFGFAGALSEIGLPEGTRLASLALFNLGVELGQVLVIVVGLALVWSLRRLAAGPLLVPARIILVYGIGMASVYWVLDRLGVMV